MALGAQRPTKVNMVTATTTFPLAASTTVYGGGLVIGVPRSMKLHISAAACALTNRNATATRLIYAANAEWNDLL